MSKNVEIKRDFDAEQQNPKYTYYNMYLRDEVIGKASYRIFNNQSPYWYIDEFIIFEEFRGQGYGSCLLNYIIEKMLIEKKLPIDIYPTSHLISQETFIAWLVKRGFVKLQQEETGQILLRLQPYDLSERLHSIETGIERTKERLQEFETKYKLSTDQFIQSFNNDELSHSFDFDEWIGESRMLKHLQEKKEEIEEVKFVN